MSATDKAVTPSQVVDIVNTAMSKITLVTKEAAGLVPPLPKNPYVDGFIPPTPQDITYKFQIDQSVSDPAKAVTYLDDLVGHETGWDAWKDDPLFWEVQPCLVKNGKVNYYLQRDDYTKKVDGSASVLTGEDGEVMVQFPHMKYKYEKSGNIITIEITTKNISDTSYKDTAFKRNTTASKYVYIGAYPSCNIDSTMHSYSKQKIATGLTYTNYLDYSSKAGTNFSMMSYSQWVLLQMLYLLVFQNLNSQKTVGNGYGSGSGYSTTGYTDKFGFVHGSTSDTFSGVRCFGIEDIWNNHGQLVQGLVSRISSSSSSNVQYAISQYQGGSTLTVEDTTLSANVGNFFKGTSASKFSDTPFLPYDSTDCTGGSATKYYCDTVAVSKPTSTGSAYEYHAAVGGNYNVSTNSGIFCTYLNQTASQSATYNTCRIVFIPDPE